MTLDLQLTDAVVEAAIAPYLEERLAPDAERWRQILKRAKSKYRLQLHRRRKGEFARTVDNVQSTYTRYWSGDLEVLFSRSRPVPFEWRGEGLLLAPLARRRLNHLLLTRAIAACGARQLLDVGTGNGFNLFLLAAQRPELQLTGLELTAAGMAAAQAIAREPELPELIASVSAEPVVSRTAHKRVRLLQGSAANLPFDDNTFDAVTTVLALEQMESIRDRALAELRRVTRRWVIMVEPFRNLNATGPRADYVRAHDYFSETIEGLPAHGLMPRAVYIDVPNKLRLHVGLVVAERV
jgi:SAM-dependent methyltransferase